MAEEIRLKVEYVPIEEIKPYAGNAKLHPAEQIEQIKQSIRDFGMNDPIAVWNDEIVEGHGRLIACSELGMTEIPVIRLDGLTDEQRRAYGLAHNKLTMNTGFEFVILSEELEKIESFDMSAYGFDVKVDDDMSEFFTEEEKKEEPEEEKDPADVVYDVSCDGSRVKELVALLTDADFDYEEKG